MKLKTPYEILDEISQKHVPQDINLSENILRHIRKEKQMMKRSRIIVVCSVLLAAFLIAAIKVPVVAHAIQRLFGYLPGSGLVDTSGEIYVLQEPVLRKFDGTSLSILQVVADQTQTIVTLQIENLPAQSNSEIGTRCSDLPDLILPDGTVLSGTSNTMDTWSSGYRRRIIYPAMPEDTKTGRLKISCYELVSVELGNEGVNLPFELIPAPANMTVYPLVTLPTPTDIPVSKPDTSLESEATNQILPGINDFRLDIQQYSQTTDEIVFTGVFRTDVSDVHLLYFDPESIHLIDNGGSEIAIQEDYDMLAKLQQSSRTGEIPIAYHTAGNFTAGAATINVDSVWIAIDGQFEFTVNIGDNPQPGQEWNLNIPVTFAGHTATITAVKMNERADGYTFMMDVPDDFHISAILDQNHEVLGGGGDSETLSMTYAGSVPNGLLHLVIPGFEVKINGPWQAQIELPDLHTAANDMASQPACLTVDNWRTLIQGQSATNCMPGKLMLYQLVGPEYHYWIALGELQSGQTQLLATGDNPSLSPDGRQIVYATDQGIALMNIAGGDTIMLAGTTKMDRGPIWSPDGTQIVFSHGPESGLIDGPGTYQLMLSTLDGNTPRTILQNGDANIAQAWAPDGESVYFVVKSAEGAIVKNITLSSGDIKSLFTISYVNAGIAISPDGEKVAYEDMLPGDRYAIFVADSDGKNPVLIADMFPLVATHPMWSPDSRWLMISVQDTDISEVNPVLSMVDVDNCEVIPLLNFQGYLTTWIP